MSLDPNMILQGPLVGAQTQNTQQQANLTQAQALNTPAAMQANIANTQAQTQNLQAQNPGMAAQSATQVRDLAAKQLLSLSADQYMVPDPNNPGQMMADPTKVAMVLNHNGFADKALEFQQANANVLQSQIANATSQVQQNNIKAAAGNDAANHIGVVLNEAAKNGMPDDQLVQLNQKLIAYHAGLLGPGVVSPNLLSPDQNAAGIRTWAANRAAATIMPSEQAQLANQKEQAEAAHIGANASATNAQIAGLTQQQNAQLQIVNAQTEKNKGAVYGNIAKNIPNILANTPNGFQNYTGAKLKQYLDGDAPTQNLANQLQPFNAEYGTSYKITDSPEALATAFLQGAKQHTSQAGAYAGVAAAGGAPNPQTQNVNPQVTPMTGQPGDQQPVSQNSPQAQRMTDPSGRVYTIPPAKLQEALKRGFKPVQ